MTKNGYGSMVVLSKEGYSKIVNSLELMLDEADKFAESDSKRLTHSKVFEELRK